MEVNSSFPTNYQCNQALHYIANRFVVILIINYFKTFKMPVANFLKWSWLANWRSKFPEFKIEKKRFDLAVLALVNNQPIGTYSS